MNQIKCIIVLFCSFKYLVSFPLQSHIFFHSTRISLMVWPAHGNHCRQFWVTRELQSEVYVRLFMPEGIHPNLYICTYYIYSYSRRLVPTALCKSMIMPKVLPTYAVGGIGITYSCCVRSHVGLLSILLGRLSAPSWFNSSIYSQSSQHNHHICTESHY